MYVFQYEIKFIGTKRLLNLKAKTKTERKTEMETDSDRDLWNLVDLLDLMDHLRTLCRLGRLFPCQKSQSKQKTTKKVGVAKQSQTCNQAKGSIIFSQIGKCRL